MSLARRSGALFALRTLGITKVGYVTPALLGGAVGAGAGFLAAPENRRLEGALAGGALGGAGGAAGKYLGNLKNTMALSGAKRNLANELAKPQGDLFSNLAAKTRLSKIEKAVASNAAPIQGATLGGLLGAGTGAYSIAKQPYVPDEYEDPYGYRFRTQ